MRKKIIGQIKSKTTNRIYDVSWDENNGETWICRSGLEIEIWEQICREVYYERVALRCSQKFIDSQPMTY